MELTGDPDRISIAYERKGGIVRITGAAPLRDPLGDVRQPVTIVLRQEDAHHLGGALVTKLSGI